MKLVDLKQRVDGGEDVSPREIVDTLDGNDLERLALTILMALIEKEDKSPEEEELLLNSLPLIGLEAITPQQTRK